MNKGTIERNCTRGETAGSLQGDLENPAWLFFALQRERLCCEDEGDRDSLWYTLIVRAIKAVRRKDMAEVRRVVATLAECAETQNK